MKVTKFLCMLMQYFYYIQCFLLHRIAAYTSKRKYVSYTVNIKLQYTWELPKIMVQLYFTDTSMKQLFFCEVGSID